MKYFPLRHAVLFEVKGPHASRYLQARLTNDVNSLGQERGMLAAALTPQGKTEGLFTVMQRDDNSYLLYADGGERGAVLQGLRRFLVAERVDIVDCSESFAVVHYIDTDAPGMLAGVELPAAREDAAEYAVRRLGRLSVIRKRRGVSAGWDVIVPVDIRDEFFAALAAAHGAPLAETAVELFRLKGGVPKFPDEINEQHLFVSSGLTQAVSFTKGCYTGQEVVAKIDALGKSPRVLKLLHAPSSSVSAGADIIDAAQGKAIGKVLTAAVENGATLCFADLRNIDGIEALPLRIGDTRAEIIHAGTS